MIDFEEYIGVVVMEEILGDTCALRHPVKPNPKTGSVDVIVGYFNIDRAVELDSRHFSARKVPSHVNIVNSVVGDRAEGNTETTDDSGLAAVVYDIVAHNVV